MSFSPGGALPLIFASEIWTLSDISIYLCLGQIRTQLGLKQTFLSLFTGLSGNRTDSVERVCNWYQTDLILPGSVT